MPGQVQAFYGYRIAIFAQSKPFQRRYQHSVILSLMWNQCVHPNLTKNRICISFVKRKSFKMLHLRFCSSVKLNEISKFWSLNCTKMRLAAGLCTAKIRFVIVTKFILWSPFCARHKVILYASQNILYRSQSAVCDGYKKIWSTLLCLNRSK